MTIVILFTTALPEFPRVPRSNRFSSPTSRNEKLAGRCYEKPAHFGRSRRTHPGTELARSAVVRTKADRAAGEKLKTEAQALVSAGKPTAALERYARAAEALPDDGWLHHAAGELARRLKQEELAAMYFRKAGVAFVASGLGRYALPPFRNAWLYFQSALPEHAAAFEEVTRELAAVQRQLGFETDANQTEKLSGEALETVAGRVRAPRESQPPRESMARALKTAHTPPHSVPPRFRHWLERVRKALTA
jgi:tetratricopeptide (TPR) repeat protein